MQQFMLSSTKYANIFALAPYMPPSRGKDLLKK